MMAESLQIKRGATKVEIYQEILPQIKAIISSETDLVANLGNISAILMQAFLPLWVGFYFRKGDQLVLGPFQGPLACTRIPVKPIARGVCGVSAERMETLVVPDVNQFSGHIACSSDAQSEIVVPLILNGETKLVLDIDSKTLNAFDAIDKQYLEDIIAMIAEIHSGDLA